MNPEFAIIDPNTLAAIGLQRILEGIVPSVVIRLFPSFQALMDDTPYAYAHYFVASRVYFEHPAFFRETGRRTIVLTASEHLPQISGVHTLNISQPEPLLVRSVLQLCHQGHPCGMGGTPYANSPTNSDLSPREIEVLVLLARGFINKEIADKLHISLTTVISHRKNIVSKLGIRSLSGLAVYAVMHGYVDIDCI